MIGHLRLGFLGFLIGCVGIGVAFGQEEAPATEPSLDSVFGLDRVIDVHLEIPAEEWAKMQPPPGTKMDFGVAMRGIMMDAIMGGNFRKASDVRPGVAGYLGVNHQYGKGTVTMDGDRVDGVGIRYKGNGTFLNYVEGDPTVRLSFKIDFNEFDSEQSWRGVTKINLNNNTTDPSFMREPLSYELFREAGVPCSRVGYARVSVTVPGQFDRSPHGLYTVVEQVDKRFLKDRYGSAKGLLMKPSTFGAFRYLGEDWADYELGYVPKIEPTETQKQRVIEFARLVHMADESAFAAQIAEYLDVDQFLRFLAVNVLLVNLDSFLGGAQNHYVYLEPESNKFQYLPWDMDHSFGSFVMVGTAESRRKLSIDHPGGHGHTLVERVLGISEHRETYHRYLETYLDTWFAEEALHQRIEEVASFVRPLCEVNGEWAQGKFDRILADRSEREGAQPLKYFVSLRRASIQRQLRGDSEGVILHDDPPEPAQIIGWGLAVLGLLGVNGIAWLWGGVAGFRGSVGWGFLNLFVYPVTPMIYGFRIRKDLGRRPAIMAVVGVLWLVGMMLVGAFLDGK